MTKSFQIPKEEKHEVGGKVKASNVAVLYQLYGKQAWNHLSIHYCRLSYRSFYRTKNRKSQWEEKCTFIAVQTTGFIGESAELTKRGIIMNATGRPTKKW